MHAHTESAPEGRAAPACRRVRRWLRIAAAVAAVLVLAGFAAVFAFPRSSGGLTVRVQGSSMGDAYPLGSLAITKPAPRAFVERGDVVLRTDGDVPVLHRVVRVEEDGDGRLRVITKGDANRDRDPTPWTLPPIVHVAERHIPHLGYALGAVGTPVGWTLAIVLPATFITAITVVGIWSPTPQRGGPAHAGTLLVLAALATTSLALRSSAVLTDAHAVDANTFTTASTFP